MKAYSSSSRQDGSHGSSRPEVGSSSQEGKKKAKEKIARHQTELQSVREDELSHGDEVNDGASEHDQDDTSIPDVGGSTQKNGMKVRRRDGSQAEGASQNSKRTSTVDRNFALYTERKDEDSKDGG
ncbi:hypothetical protein BGX27_003008 [Mortierella sp. AM989]|nr:hypothetical protein BGX27_003008 [Mortierella sp. AM989]